MSAISDLREEWYIRPSPGLLQTRELLFEKELELLRKKKKERISGILSSFFGASIAAIIILIIFLYNYLFQ